VIQEASISARRRIGSETLTYTDTKPPVPTKILTGISRQLAKWIVPGNRHSQRAYSECLDASVEPGCDWLDLGCGHKILPPWVGLDEPNLVGRCHSVAGLDLDFPSLRKNQIFAGRVVMANLEQIPFAERSFDLVTANMVVEHLAEPRRVLEEVHRVLRPGGRFLFNTPNRQAPALRIAAHTPEGIKKQIVWWLERRAEEDVFPTFYRMNKVDDIQRLAQAAGFRVTRLDQISSTPITFLLGPLVLPELVFIRILESDRWARLRSNLLVVLEKVA
jgi:ubiquinone/menaquinone biosynthesis C-methylase UbiE